MEGRLHNFSTAGRHTDDRRLLVNYTPAMDPHARASPTGLDDPQRSRILVVEDDAVVTETLALYLEHAGFLVSTAADGLQALRSAREEPPAVVILDLMIPGIEGHEVCRQLRAESAVAILMLTSRTSEDDRILGLTLGADDYVAKPFSPREVVARVQALLRRSSAGPAAPPPPVRVGDLEVHLWSRQVRVGGRLVSLTPTEYRLLEMLARSPERTFTRAELVARVFGPDFTGFDRTIDSHITNLRRKLDQGTGGAYVVTVHGIGYRLATRDDLEP